MNRVESKRPKESKQWMESELNLELAHPFDSVLYASSLAEDSPKWISRMMDLDL